MYRFHPSVKWSSGYPDRQQIVSQIIQLWKHYGLQERTKFNTRVTSVTQDKQGRWIINDPSSGRFDGIIAAVGSCGEPKIPHMLGQEKFKGEYVIFSELFNTYLYLLLSRETYFKSNILLRHISQLISVKTMLTP